MIPRVLIALVGAVIVTTGLLLAMEAVTSMFRERDPTRYFRIDDVILRDRSRPDPPRPVARQPDTPDAAIDVPPPSLTIDDVDEPAPDISIPARLRQPEIATEVDDEP